MNDQRLNLPKFYITAPSPCPYLGEKMERKIFTNLDGPNPNRKHSDYSQKGFRRSQNIVYRPACENCTKCVSVRVRVQDFIPGKSLARTIRKFQNLIVNDQDPFATAEQFELLKTYLDARHAGGSMSDMDEFEYAEMVESSPVMTRLVEYRSQRPQGTKHRQGDLAAIALTDIVSDGLSLVYSFFKTDKANSGLGTFIILDHILKAQTAGLSYLYLGYWIKDSKSMGYKERFRPLEFYSENGWHDLPKQ